MMLNCCCVSPERASAVLRIWPPPSSLLPSSAIIDLRTDFLYKNLNTVVSAFAQMHLTQQPQDDGKPALLIIGIDPGTTTGYAALSLDGGLVGMGSAKELGQDELVKRLMQLGRVAAIGTDKQKCPAFVEKVAARLGARLVIPKQDLSSEVKRLLCRGEKTQNCHEQDALASALFAYQSLRPLLGKIQRHLAQLNALGKIYEVSKLVLTAEDMGISRALDTLKAPEEAMPVKVKPEPPKLKELSPEEILRLQHDNKLLRCKNQVLRQKVAVLERKHDAAKVRLRTVIDEKKAKHLLSLRDRAITSLKQTLKTKDEALDDAKMQIAERDQALADTSQMVVLKRLENLSRLEWSKKEKGLNVQKGDIILVDEPNTASSEVIAELARKCTMLVYLTPPKSVAVDLRNAGFTLLDGRAMKLRAIGQFFMVSRTALEKEQERQLSFTTLLAEYKRERHPPNE